MASAPNESSSSIFNNNNNNNNSEDVVMDLSPQKRPTKVIKRSYSLTSNNYSPIKTPFLNPKVQQFVRESRQSKVTFSKWKEPSSILYPSKLLISSLCRLAFPLFYIFTLFVRIRKHDVFGEITGGGLTTVDVRDVLKHLHNSMSLIAATVHLFFYVVAFAPIIIHKYNTIPENYFEEHIGSWGEIFSPILMLIITSLTFAVWDATGLNIANPLLDLVTCINSNDADITRDLGLGGIRPAKKLWREADADERRSALIERMGFRARTRRRILKEFKFESTPLRIGTRGLLRCTEYCRQCQSGEYSADVLVDQIMLSSTLARNGPVTRAFYLLLCFASSLTLALIPTIVRLSYNNINRMNTGTVFIAIAYFISAFTFTWIHSLYFFRAIDVYSERKTYMNAVTSMAMLSDHEPHFKEQDEYESVLFTESDISNHLERERKQFQGRHPLFPIELPQLDLSMPDHVVVFSKLRVFMQNILSSSITKYSYHLSLLFVPLTTLGFAILIEYLFFRQASHEFLTGTYIVMTILIVLGTLMFATFLKAAAVNSLEMSHVMSLRRAQFRISEKIYNLRRYGKLDDAKEQRLNEANLLLNNLCDLIQSLGPSCRVLGMRVDYSFIFGLLGFLFWAFMTQFLRILLSK